MSRMHQIKNQGKILRSSGALLIGLGIVHLAATSHIPSLLEPMRSDPGYVLAPGATLLNHIITGILLLPLRYTTWVASAPVHVTHPWAPGVLTFNSVTMLGAPVAIAIFMRDPAYLRAPLFLAGVFLATLVPVLMLVAVLSLWRLRF